MPLCRKWFIITVIKEAECTRPAPGLCAVPSDWDRQISAERPLEASLWLWVRLRTPQNSTNENNLPSAHGTATLFPYPRIFSPFIEKKRQTKRKTRPFWSLVYNLSDPTRSPSPLPSYSCLFRQSRKGSSEQHRNLPTWGDRELGCKYRELGCFPRVGPFLPHRCCRQKEEREKVGSQHPGLVRS